MPLKYFKSDAKGLTLIECVISILILCVMIAGGLVLYTNASAIMSKAMQKKMALEMAIQEMEEIKGAGYNSPDNQATGVWSDLPNKTFGLNTSQPFTTQMRRKIT